MSDERLWTNEETDGMAGGDKTLADEIAKARFHVRRIVKDRADKQARIEAVKAYFDSLDGQYIKRALNL